MTSILTNGRAAGQGLNPGFVFLNLFGGVLDAKLEVRRSSTDGDHDLSPAKCCSTRCQSLTQSAGNGQAVSSRC